MSAPVAPAVGTDEWLRRVGALTRSVVLEQWHPRSCVASTRVQMDVLAYYGVAAEARPVVFTAYAPETVAWHRAHPTEPGPAPVGWTVAINADDAPRHKNYPGHLLVDLPGRERWLDVSIDQASRPEKNMVIEEPALLTVPTGYFDQPGRVVEYTTATGVLIAYRPLHGPYARHFRDGRDWRNTPQRRAAAGHAIRACRREGL